MKCFVCRQSCDRQSAFMVHDSNGLQDMPGIPVFVHHTCIDWEGDLVEESLGSGGPDSDLVSPAGSGDLA